MIHLAEDRPVRQIIVDYVKQGTHLNNRLANDQAIVLEVAISLFKINSFRKQHCTSLHLIVRTF